MEEVILICGRLCSGKTTYAEKLVSARGAVLLSVDEVMLAIFGQFAGEKHDEYTRGVKRYLLHKAAELAEKDVPVVLDWGFWKRQERAEVREFFRARGVPCALHYLTVDDPEWARRIAARNAAVQAGRADAYFVDEGLRQKFFRLFEPPEEGEYDVKVES